MVLVDLASALQEFGFLRVDSAAVLRAVRFDAAAGHSHSVFAALNIEAAAHIRGVTGYFAAGQRDITVFRENGASIVFCMVVADPDVSQCQRSAVIPNTAAVACRIAARDGAAAGYGQVAVIDDHAAIVGLSGQAAVQRAAQVKGDHLISRDRKRAVFRFCPDIARHRNDIAVLRRIDLCLERCPGGHFSPVAAAGVVVGAAAGAVVGVAAGAVVGSAFGVARHDLVLLDRGLELFFIFLVFRVRGQLLI